MIYVLYDNDPDGFGAAFAAWLKFGDSAKYLPVKRGEPIPDLPDAEHVYIVDFSYPREELLALWEKTKHQLTLLDHHQSAFNELGDLPFCIFDMSSSGAVVAWRHFHPAEPVPIFFGYIQDADLWQWRLPFSREIHEAVESWPLGNFMLWGGMSGITARTRNRASEAKAIEDLIKDGEICLRYARQKIAQILENVREVVFFLGANPRISFDLAEAQEGSMRVPVINTCVFQSEACNDLLAQRQDAKMVACYYDDANGVRHWNLRSREGFDCSLVASAFGGGGHQRASGFRTHHDTSTNKPHDKQDEGAQ